MQELPGKAACLTSGASAHGLRGQRTRALDPQLPCPLLLLQVAAGYRVPLNPKLPSELCRLISDCWAGLPDLRPSMPEVVLRLRQVLEDEETLQLADAATGPSGGGGGCCTLM